MVTAALDNLTLLERAVEGEIRRLSPTPGYGQLLSAKTRQISDALDRIFVMTLQQNPTMKDTSRRFIIGVRINPKEASEIDLKTMNAMLDAHISVWEDEIPPSTEPDTRGFGREAGFYPQISLREALNISDSNIFNHTFLFGEAWGPLFGKDESLVNVENALGLTTDR